MSTESAPADAYLEERLEASLRLVREQQGPAVPVISSFDTASDDTLLVTEAAVATAQAEAARRLEEHVWLLEAVGEWDYDEARGLVPRPEQWARLAALIVVAKDTLDNALKAITRDLAASLPRDQVFDYEEAPAFFLRSSGRRRAWQHDDLAPKVIAAITDKEALPCSSCGTRLDVQDVERVIRAWTDVCAYHWKTGPPEGQPATSGLRKLGINPSDYSSWVGGDPILRFVVPLTAPQAPPNEEPAIERWRPDSDEDDG